MFNYLMNTRKLETYIPKNKYSTTFSNDVEILIINKQQPSLPFRIRKQQDSLTCWARSPIQNSWYQEKNEQEEASSVLVFQSPKLLDFSLSSHFRPLGCFPLPGAVLLCQRKTVLLVLTWVRGEGQVSNTFSASVESAQPNPSRHRRTSQHMAPKGRD